ncbi:MAG: DUF2914 domain-containing protein [Chitinispirillaceae bacterium]|nr:DUF2914 domain-containing protein [Chitinispirillaceae bacterium]
MKEKSFAVAILVIWSLLNAQTPAENKSTTGEIKKENPNTTVQSTPQQVSDMSVGRAVIALDIVDRVPQDTGTIFPAEVKRLYCYSEILNGEGGEIQHRWYWNDELLNSVSLKISSKRFRTYSAKTIFPHMKGKWRVAIVNSANEAALKWLEFTIE